MKKSDVLEHFGSVRKTAMALNCTPQYVYQWRPIIPEGVAYKLQVITGGKLRVNPTDYEPRRA